MDQTKTSMPPPQTLGISGNRPHEYHDMKYQGLEVMTQDPQMKKHHLNEEGSPGGDIEATPPLDSTPNTITNPIVTWENCSDQLMKELEADGKCWGTQWRELHEEENAAMSRIQHLHKTALEMNMCFHQQLDSLHNTVVDLVSSFKK